MNSGQRIEMLERAVEILAARLFKDPANRERVMKQAKLKALEAMNLQLGETDA